VDAEIFLCGEHPETFWNALTDRITSCEEIDQPRQFQCSVSSQQSFPSLNHCGRVYLQISCIYLLFWEFPMRYSKYYVGYTASGDHHELKRFIIGFKRGVACRLAATSDLYFPSI
jgi:hypothetical protein